jgi:tetratricopeptide (TPR) repeat protein
LDLFHLIKQVILGINKLQILITAGLCSIILACSTTKSKDDVSAIGKLYHNTTAQYNGYFNADVLLQQSIANLETQVQDNYLDVLPIYKYAEASNPMAEAPNLDNAIEKVTVVVSLHRVSDWTDDCYLMMGKAQYLKKDYESSMETLEFLADEYSPSAMEKRERDAEAVKKGKKKSGSSAKKKKKRRKKRRRKKRRRKPSSKKKKSSSQKKASSSKNQKTESTDKEESITGPVGMISLGKNIGTVEEDKDGNTFKNPPAYFEGLYWLSRNYIDIARYSDATRLLDQLARSQSCPDEVKRLIPNLMAYMFSKKKDYASAITYLDQSVEMEKDKFERARLLFIAGQMSKKINQNAQANKYFNQVVALHPEYELEFNAGLLAAQTSSGTSLESMIRKLENMLKEDKNSEYKDQIYYAIADSYLKNGNTEKGIENLELSLSIESRNPVQAAESSYRLAMLYYDSQEYVDAKTYLDQTLNTMQRSDDRYNKVRILSESLDGIAKALETIELQDSLIRISKLSEEEKIKLAQQIKDEEEAQRIAALKGDARNMSNAVLIGKSDFYAYDSKAIKRGIRDFQNKWGDRPLDDNWRRKEALGIGQSNLFDDEIVKNTKVTEEEVEEIFKLVPKSEKEVDIANLKIMEAMLELGKLYRSDLKEPKKSIAILEDLLDRKPENNKMIIESYYFVYLAYLDIDDAVNSKKYLDLILENFPNSPIAASISDPNFANKKSKEDLVNDYYEECYSDFKSESYQLVIDKIAKVPSKFGSKHQHNARFGLLRAFCVGKIDGREKYIQELELFLIKYPNTPEEKQVREILRILGADVKETIAAEEGDIDKYVVEPSKVHYIILTFDDKNVSLTSTRNSISDFNADYFGTSRLRSSNISLGAKAEDKVPIIVVRRFNNKEKAMEYIDTLDKNGKENMAGIGFKAYAVSQSNYRTILKDKKMGAYPDFYEINY